MNQRFKSLRKQIEAVMKLNWKEHWPIMHNRPNGSKKEREREKEKSMISAEQRKIDPKIK